MRENRALKVISYILLPIFIGIIIISILYSFAKDSYIKNTDEYFETTSFSEDYIRFLSMLARETIYTDNDYAYIDDNGYRVYYVNLDNYNYNVRLKDNYVLVIYNDKAITNVNNQDITTIEEIKQYIQEQNRRKSKCYKWTDRIYITCAEI